jgi:hypothetical protein
VEEYDPDAVGWNVYEKTRASGGTRSGCERHAAQMPVSLVVVVVVVDIVLWQRHQDNFAKTELKWSGSNARNCRSALHLQREMSVKLLQNIRM